MKFVNVNDIDSYKDKKVTIKGWVYNSRSSGKIGFLMLRDGFGIIQCIVEKNKLGDESFSLFKTLTQESSIKVKGLVVKNERALGGFEILVDNFEIYQLSKDYPITPKEHGIDYLMNNRHLWLRSKKQHAILKIRHRIIKSVRDFFANTRNDFISFPCAVM